MPLNWFHLLVYIFIQIVIYGDFEMIFRYREEVLNNSTQTNFTEYNVVFHKFKSRIVSFCQHSILSFRMVK